MVNRTHDILILKGDLKHAPNPKNRMILQTLKSSQEVTSRHLKKLANDLRIIRQDWNVSLLSDQMLITADYREVVAKSNRMTNLLKPKGNIGLSEFIKGARFEKIPGQNGIHHVITYFVPCKAVETTILKLESAAKVVDDVFGGSVNGVNIKNYNFQKGKGNNFSRSGFYSLIKDAYYVTGFRLSTPQAAILDKSLVSLYRVGDQAKLIDILRQLNINVSSDDFLNEDTLRLDAKQREQLGEKAGWLIAMEVRDLMEFDYRGSLSAKVVNKIELPKPTNEPVVGVIDTRFDERVIFSDWVEYHDLIPESIPSSFDDFIHGTAVSSLIVAGSLINPEYEDGCGFFRVKHFGVATHAPVSTFDLLRHIQKIIRENQDIKVWNLSLGSVWPVDKNFISPEAAELDRLQKQYDVLFIVAGTNDGSAQPDGDLTSKYIGAPADSLNSIVVGACDLKGDPTSYTRRGPVLNFFIKPDLAAFGGTNRDYLFVCTPNGREPKTGTSFAAPWVTRKAAYLIYKLQLSRTEAKALLIDAAVGWNKSTKNCHWIGRGVIPQRVENIAVVPEDEIRFIISGKVSDFETYTYDLPIPKNGKGKYDYSVRVTLCYFPECRRDQGVDYPLTELDLHFGRVKSKNGRMTIKSISNNLQSDDAYHDLPEVSVRSDYRKWDNVKTRSYFCGRYYGVENDEQTWGMQIYTKERLSEKFGRGLPFTLVVTLKSKDGEDRNADFVKACQAKGWIVNSLNLDTRLQLAAQLQEEIDLI